MRNAPERTNSSAADSLAPTPKRGLCPDGVSAVTEPVPDAAHGLDELGLGRIALELFAEMANVNVDRARLAVRRVAPERLEQHLARENSPRLGRQRAQELELDVGQLHVAAVSLDEASVEIDPQAVRLD